MTLKDNNTVFLSVITSELRSDLRLMICACIKLSAVGKKFFLKICLRIATKIQFQSEWVCAFPKVNTFSIFHQIILLLFAFTLPLVGMGQQPYVLLLGSPGHNVANLFNCPVHPMDLFPVGFWTSLSGHPIPAGFTYACRTASYSVSRLEPSIFQVESLLSSTRSTHTFTLFISFPFIFIR